jgi:hypothetical protein
VAYGIVNKIALALKRIIWGPIDDGTHPVGISSSGAPLAVEATGSIYLRDDAPDPGHVLYVRQGGAWSPLSPGGGGVPPGAPNAIAYYDPAGVTLVTDANLVAAPTDAFGRPQIWDHRFILRGAVFRQGAWMADGDAINVKSEGVVSYGSNALNAGPSATDGGFFFETPHSFGQYQIVNGVNGNNLFPVCAWEDASADAPGIGTANHFELRDDANRTTFSIDRPTSNTFISGTDAAGVSTAGQGFLFMGNNGVLHGSAARIQLSSTLTSAPQFRGNQYGANAGVPGISTFKSRGATIGSLAGIIAGDVMGGWTAVGVAPDNVSIPLAGTLQFRVPLAFVPVAQNWAPSELVLELVALTGPINGRRVCWKVNSEGEVQSLFNETGRPPAANAGYATYITLGDAFPLSKISGVSGTGGQILLGPGGALGEDIRILRVAPSGTPQVQIDDALGGGVHVIPATDNTGKLGTRSVADFGTDAVSKRWQEVNAVVVNTGDLNLIDEKKNAHWTIVEEHDRILVINRKTGKRYRMALEEEE